MGNLISRSQECPLKGNPTLTSSLNKSRTARRSNQSFLNEIDPEYSLERLTLGKTEGRKRSGETEDEMVGRHPRCSGHELVQTLGDGEEQRSLVCCSPRGRKESDMTWQLNNNNSYRIR